jgi:hypothetical protein
MTIIEADVQVLNDKSAEKARQIIRNRLRAVLYKREESVGEDVQWDVVYFNLFFNSFCSSYSSLYLDLYNTLSS